MTKLEFNTLSWYQNKGQGWSREIRIVFKVLEAPWWAFTLSRFAWTRKFAGKHIKTKCFFATPEQYEAYKRNTGEIVISAEGRYIDGLDLNAQH